MYESDLINALFYSCLNNSTEDGERMRRAGEYGTIRIIDFNGAVPIPQKLEKIWPSIANKESFQLVARDIRLSEREFPNVLASSITIKDELLTAQLNIDGSDVSDIPEL